MEAPAPNSRMGHWLPQCHLPWILSPLLVPTLSSACREHPGAAQCSDQWARLAQLPSSYHSEGDLMQKAPSPMPGFLSRTIQSQEPGFPHWPDLGSSLSILIFICTLVKHKPAHLGRWQGGDRVFKGVKRKEGERRPQAHLRWLQGISWSLDSSPGETRGLDSFVRKWGSQTLWRAQCSFS